MKNFALALALVSTIACSINTDSGSSSGSTANVTANGTVTGPVVGTITKASVTALTTPGQSQGLQIGIQAALGSSSANLALTTPAADTLDSASLTIILQFTDTPSSGTYTNTSADIGTQYDTLMSLGDKNNAGVAMYGSGKNASTPSPITLVIKSITATKSSSSTTLYEVHGSLDTTMAGGHVVTANGMSTAASGIVVHLDF